MAGEFQVFLGRAGRSYRNVSGDDIRVTVVELGQRILPALDEDLAQYATDRMRRRGMTVELGVTVNESARVQMTDGHLEDDVAAPIQEIQALRPGSVRCTLVCGRRPTNSFSCSM